MTYSKRWLAAVTALAAAANLEQARATDVFRLEGFGAVSRGMGGVATAVDTGPAGMLTNPATLSLSADTSSVMGGLDMVSTHLVVEDRTTGEAVTSGDHGNNRGPYFAPELAVTHRLGRVTFGLGAFAEGGLGTEYGTQSFLSTATGGLRTGLDNSSRLLVLDIPLAASYQWTDRLTVGASIDAIWQGLNLDLLLGADQVGSLIGAGRATGSLIPVLGGLPALRGAHFSLTRDNALGSGVSAFGVAGRLGATYLLGTGTRLGLAYTLKSAVADMGGHARLTAIDAQLGQIPLDGRIEIKDFQMPAVLSAGVAQQLSPRLLVSADLSEVFWSGVMKDIKVGFVAEQGTLNVQLPQDYRDQTVFALGAAYQATHRLTVRAGVRIASQALRSPELFAVIPATPTRHASVGLSYVTAVAGEIDFAYSHAFAQSMDNSSLPDTSAPIHTVHSQNNVIVSYHHRF